MRILWKSVMSIIINNGPKKFISNVIGRYINSPEQRLIQGVTALGIQPFIDYNNDSADQETRAVSVARTIGKIVAGTITGVLIRYAAIYATKAFSEYKIQKIISGYVESVGAKSKKDIFMPNLSFERPSKTPKEFKTMYDNYIKTMGTLVATFTMLFTNFLVDAPFTKYITKKLTPVVKRHINPKEANNESC